MRNHIVRSIRFASQKREAREGGLDAEANESRICLLELFLPGQGLAQRRAIQVQIGGESVWREFEIVRSFDDAEAAAQYASEHGIDDVEI